MSKRLRSPEPATIALIFADENKHKFGIPFLLIAEPDSPIHVICLVSLTQTFAADGLNVGMRKKCA